MSSRLVVIGSGPMGLAAAYHAAKAGHEVEVLEGAPVPGGMAAHFDFDGVSIERFYHFVCKTDYATFELLNDIGLGDAMRWRTTTMGHFIDGRLHKMGDPISLMKFPAISILSRLRYGLFAFICTRRERWDAIETESARSWITRWCGKQVFEKLWKPLLDLKFHRSSDNISAAWIWTRIKRIGRSRKSMFQEELGYMEGGSQTLVDGLIKEIERLGGKIRLSCPAKRILIEDGKVTGVETPQGIVPADRAISTVPTPYLHDLVRDMPPEWVAKYDAIQNIGVCCVLFKLKRSVTPHFWVNVTEPDIEVPGFIEFSNLRPLEDTVVYVPYYMPTDHPKFSWPDEKLVEESFAYLQRVNPAVAQSDIIATHVGRLRHAQPICEPGFASKIPPIVTPIEGLQIADTCFYYPEDRGISESVRVAKEMAARLTPVPPLRSVNW